MPETPATLFDKYGGIPGVRELVRQFHERFIAKPTLRRYFDGVDPQKLIQHHVEMIAYAMGKPSAAFQPQKMAADHHPRGITLSAYEQVINIFRQVLLDASVEGRDIAEIIHRMDLQRHRVVRDAKPVSNIYNPEHIDALTGLGNIDALYSALQIEADTFSDGARPLSLALMRPCGSGRDALPTDPRVLHMMERHLAGVLARTVREADLLCRCADGRFALVLRATDAAKALPAARRLQTVVTREPFIVSGSRLGIELAIGLASMGGQIGAAAELTAAADRALQSAMVSGKQRIVAAI